MDDPSLDELLQRLGRGPEGGQAQREPYKFLDPYGPADSDIFFGRDEEKKELFRKFYARPLMLVYGESGTGKTSLLQCGLLSQIPASDLLLVPVRSSGGGLRAALLALRGLIGQELPEAPREALALAYRAKRKPLAFLFDQLEELFILGARAARDAFVKEVATWLELPFEVRLVFCLREEYLARLTEFEAVLPELFSNRLWLRRIDPVQLRDVIRGPCAVCGVGIEPEVVEAVVDHFRRDPRGADFPDLQVLMDRLYREARARAEEPVFIRQADLRRLGSIENALAAFVEESLAALPDPQLGREVLKRMVTPEGTKKPWQGEEGSV